MGELFDDDDDFDENGSPRLLLSSDFVAGGVTKPLEMGKFRTRSGASDS